MNPQQAPLIVVTGIGLITSIGNSIQEVTASLRSQKHGFQPVTFFQNPDIPVQLTGAITGFTVDSPFYQTWKYPDFWSIPKELLRGLPPHGMYAFCAIEQALQDAGLTKDDLRNDRTALFCASSGSAFLLGHNLSELERNRGMRGSPFGVISSIAGSLNFNFGSWYGIRGGNCGFSSACSSSAHALGFAWDQIHLGRIDRAIVVGAEDLNAESVLPFSAMRVLSTTSDPALASCPFDKKRSGFVASGGAAAIILERQSPDQNEKREPYAVFKSWAQSSDGFNPAISDPDGTGLAHCMSGALQRGDLSPADIDWVHAHATSTPQGDRSEARAIRNVFQNQGHSPWVSSTKGLTGHPLSMAGAMESAFALIAMKEGFVPACSHLQEPDDEMAAIRFPRYPVQEAPRAVLKNSIGFGGSNVSLVFTR